MLHNSEYWKIQNVHILRFYFCRADLRHTLNVIKFVHIVDVKHPTPLEMIQDLPRPVKQVNKTEIG